MAGGLLIKLVRAGIVADEKVSFGFGGEVPQRVVVEHNWPS
jgi:hypothetical protein